MQTQILKNILLTMILSISLHFCLTAEKENVESLKKCEIDFGSIVVKNIQSGGIFAVAPKLMMDTEIKITNPNPTEVKFYSFDLNVSLLDGENEEYLGNVLSDKETIIPANTTIILPLKIKSEFEERIDAKLIRIALKLLADLNEEKDSEILIQGHVKYNSIFGNIDIPVKEIQKARLKSK
jgi:hypothetical protein